MTDAYEKFTERARKVFSLAQEEALRLNHNYIGTEHLLLGLVREGDGIAARVLANLGVQLPKVRAAVLDITGEGKEELTGNPNLTPRAMTVIESAMNEARRLNNQYIGTEHLLLGLIREGEGVAARVLDGLGVGLDTVRQLVMQVISQSSSYQQSRQRTDEQPTPETTPRGATGRRFENSLRDLATFSHLRNRKQRGSDHNYIGTEHLLLGLVREGDGIAARVLANLGVQLPKVRSAVEFIIGRGDGLIVGDPGLTPRGKKVIELAMDESRRLNNLYIGTEHLLLGLVREGEGVAAGVLESLGVSLEKVRQEVMKTLSQASVQQQTTSHITCQIDVPLADYMKLRGIAEKLGGTVEDLIGEAIRRVWLTEENGGVQPPPPAPPGPASDGGR